MRIIHLFLACLFVAAPVAGFAAGSTSVRAIAFIASNEKGATDSRLAPYEGTLRGNLRYESFQYSGESSGSVAAGQKSSLSLPSGGRIELEADASGNVKASFRGAAVSISDHPAVFMTGQAKGGASGVIVMKN